MEGCTLGQVLHGSATTTEAIRRAIQRSQESLRTLARRHGINPKTVAKWKKRSSVADLPTEPQQPASTVLSVEEEAIIIAFRRHTLLPLDDCLSALQATIPHLTRSSLHRCLKRHGISRLPQVKDEGAAKRKFKAYPIGYFHIDIAELRTAEGKLYLFVAIDRTSKFAFVTLYEKADRPTAVRFLEALIAAVPYRLHTVLTDNGIQFADLPKNRDGWTARYRVHRFDQICRANGIEHRLTKPNHPWTNGQVERMNRTIKEATVNRYHYDSHNQLRAHLVDFVTAYNFARRLKILKGLSPYEYICSTWTKESGRFILDPIQQMPGLNTYGGRPYRVERKKHPEPIEVPRLVVAVCGGTQPDKLSAMTREADDGLLARMLRVWPNPITFLLGGAPKQAPWAIAAPGRRRAFALHRAGETPEPMMGQVV